jgi:hypothetical protein
MKDKLEKLEKRLRKMQADSFKKYMKADDSFESHYNEGRFSAFSHSVQLIKDILNSENPNSVSNQPTEE